jgi:hypothetical protein
VTRFIMTLAIVLAAAAPASVAFADPAPTPQQMDQAKAAYVEGKALHDQGKLPEAIEKFKESYRLSKRPQLLYNIALTMEEAKQDLALFYYNKFLKDAPANDPNRPLAVERVKVLEAAALDAGNTPTAGSAATPTAGSAATPDPKIETPKPPVEAPVKIKPAGTYKAEDFQHEIVEEAPPGKPLDVSASVPQDSGWTVMLYYRVAGESKFSAKPMKWRYKELVARIPAAKMTGSAIQYYLEVKDQAGEVVTRAGKSTSPNLVNLDDKVAPRFYPDLNDDSTAVAVVEPKHGDDDNPLGQGTTAEKHHEDEPIIGAQTPDQGSDDGMGFRDVGSKKFERTKWIATGVTAAVFAASAYFFIEAGKQGTALRDDINTNAAGQSCSAPCRPFDSFDADLQSAGKRDQTLANVTFVVGVAGLAVAGYFWYRELKGHKAGEKQAGGTGSPEASLPSFLVAPTSGDGFTGAAAMGRF